MLRYAKFLVPYLIRAPRRNPAKKLVGVAVVCLLIVLAVIFIAAAVFIWLEKTFGTELAFASLGILFLLSAIIILLIINRPRSEDAQKLPTLTNDPLAKYIPESVQNNTTTQKLLHQIGENPITATATAVAVGMLLYSELIEDS